MTPGTPEHSSIATVYNKKYSRSLSSTVKIASQISNTGITPGKLRVNLLGTIRRGCRATRPHTDASSVVGVLRSTPGGLPRGRVIRPCVDLLIRACRLFRLCVDFSGSGVVPAARHTTMRSRTRPSRSSTPTGRPFPGRLIPAARHTTRRSRTRPSRSSTPTGKPLPGRVHPRRPAYYWVHSPRP